MTLDRIELRGLRARGHHGCLPAERELGQEFVVGAGAELADPLEVALAIVLGEHGVACAQVVSTTECQVR